MAKSRLAYDAWREGEVKRVGGKVQRAAEAELDRQHAQPFVERWDPRTGGTVRYRRHIAEILDRRGKTERKTGGAFSIEPAAWERIFGGKSD